jgi:hypothetical protein
MYEIINSFYLNIKEYQFIDEYVCVCVCVCVDSHPFKEYQRISKNIKEYQRISKNINLLMSMCVLTHILSMTIKEYQLKDLEYQ